MAAKIKTSITLSQAAIHNGTMIAKADRMENGSEATLSSVINTWLESQGPQKRIEACKDGNRTIGWAGYYGDHLVCQTDGAGSKDECSRQLDSWVREELSK